MKLNHFNLLIILFSSLPSFGQGNLIHPKQKIQILLLGTYHFANPGMDKFNVKVDDYSSATRQQQIQELNNSLAKFNPEKIFTENNVKFQHGTDSIFQQYKTGKWILPQNIVNERYQIGWKLAKQLNNQSVYCADASGSWFEDKVKKYADSTGLGFYNDFEDMMKEHISYLNTYFNSHTVKENLLMLNTELEQLNQNHYAYNYIFPRIGAADNYIGAELVGEWYKRNLKIYGNILKFVDSSDKRILVVFGNGHIHILKQLFKDNPDFEIVDASKYLK